MRIEVIGMTHVAGIYYNDTAAAPGWSVSVYVSGCHFHCPGCHNPEAQDFNYGEEFTAETFNKIRDALYANGVKRSLCILGGEPLAPENRLLVSRLISFCRQAYPWLQTYVWTGYTMEEIEANRLTDRSIHAIHLNADYIIDGLFEQDKRDITLKMRGSSNQRIWHNNKALATWELVE